MDPRLEARPPAGPQWVRLRVKSCEGKPTSAAPRRSFVFRSCPQKVRCTRYLERSRALGSVRVQRSYARYCGLAWLSSHRRYERGVMRCRSSPKSFLIDSGQSKLQCAAVRSYGRRKRGLNSLRDSQSECVLYEEFRARGLLPLPAAQCRVRGDGIRGQVPRPAQPCSEGVLGSSKRTC